MNRHEKEVVVSELKDLFSQSQAVFLVKYRGLTVADVQKLRSDLRKKGGKFKVTKARLMKIATNDVASIDDFKVNLKDQVGLVFAKDDAFAVAKQIVEFSKIKDSLKLLTGIFESKVLSLSEINTIASILPREVLLAQIVGLVQSPMSALARVIDQIKEKKAQESAGTN
jgi:large subunit ribosomal protein L10